MSQVHFFKGQVECLPFQKFGSLSAEKGILEIEVGGKKVDLEKHLCIGRLLQLNLPEIQGHGAQDVIKKHLDDLKQRLITQINKDRGMLRGLWASETQLVDAYFAHMHQLIDTPTQGWLGWLAGWGLKAGGVGALGYGLYRYFG